jgi:hypothetical protein
MYPFPNAVYKYFSFLNDLGFTIKEKEEVDPKAMGNGFFVFISSSAGIEIVLDRGQVLMEIGKASQDRKEWIDWSIISSVYSPTEKAYDFELDIDSQVKRLSELLRKYCLGLLKGDFSNKILHQVIQNEVGKAFLARFLQA